MLRRIVFEQFKKGLRESDTQRLSFAIVGVGFLIFLRLVREKERRPIYKKRIRAGDRLEFRLVERQGTKD